MRVAVIGGTGLVGRQTVAALRSTGHDPVPVSRSSGVDALTGEGLDDALAGSESVIDVTSTPATDSAATEHFFGTVTENLLAAEHRVGVGHHVLLSIVGLDRTKGNAHYDGKRKQEQLVEAGPVPWTILRATQFFEFAAMIVRWTRHDGVATIPPLLVQPVAVAEVAAASPRWPPANPAAGPRIWPGLSRRIWSTWPGARSPRATTPPDSSRAGATGHSASTWRARSSCRTRPPAGAASRSTPGSRARRRTARPRDQTHHLTGRSSRACRSAPVPFDA